MILILNSERTCSFGSNYPEAETWSYWVKVILYSMVKESAYGNPSLLIMPLLIIILGEIRKLSHTMLHLFCFGYINFGFSVQWVRSNLNYAVIGQFLKSFGEGGGISDLEKYSGKFSYFTLKFKSILVKGNLSSHSARLRFSRCCHF